ncbi:hypothetical protein [Chlamydia vaughanii]|uniref:hypothetical protein n=1 Tax=Chlamydia vaughanii TaxID=3112552 RepID=UPI0032B1352F
MILINISFRLILLFILCGCSTTPQKRRAIHAGRVTSQQGCSVILYPQDQPCSPPEYHWLTPKQSVITSYSFHCRGTTSLLNTEEDTIYDCDGFNHSLFKNFSVHPRIIDITRVLHKQYTVEILEGFCCYKHFRFLKAGGKSISPKHLIGSAVLLSTSQNLSMEILSSLLQSLYKKKQTYPFPKEFLFTETTVSNGEFLITATKEEGNTLLSIEMLYDLETSQPINEPSSPLP